MIIVKIWNGVLRMFHQPLVTLSDLKWLAPFPAKIALTLRGCVFAGKKKQASFWKTVGVKKLFSQIGSWNLEMGDRRESTIKDRFWHLMPAVVNGGRRQWATWNFTLIQVFRASLKLNSKSRETWMKIWNKNLIENGRIPCSATPFSNARVPSLNLTALSLLRDQKSSGLVFPTRNSQKGRLEGSKSTTWKSQL